MNKQQAKINLAYHSARHNDIENIKWKNGFLCSLRPFNFQLVEKNMHEIMHSIYCLYDDMKNNLLEKELLADLWTIVHFGKQNIQENQSNSNSKIEKLQAYIDYISWAVFGILDGSNKEQAFELYFIMYPFKKLELVAA